MLWFIFLLYFIIKICKSARISLFRDHSAALKISNENQCRKELWYTFQEFILLRLFVLHIRRDINANKGHSIKNFVCHWFTSCFYACGQLSIGIQVDEGPSIPGLRRNRFIEALLNVIFTEVLLSVGIINISMDHVQEKHLFLLNSMK